MSKTKLSPRAISLYNELLEINWAEPAITTEVIRNHTGHMSIAATLAELIGAGKVLHGNEDVQGKVLVTYTPKVKGVAYGYPLDYYKNYNEWINNKLENEVTE